MISFVQVKIGSGSSTSASATLDAAPKPGNLLVACVSCNNTEATLTGTNWNGLTLISGGSGGTKRAMRMFWKFAQSGESASPTFTLGTTAAWGCTVAEYAGITGGGTTPVTGENAQLNASGTTNTPSVTPTAGFYTLAVWCIDELASPTWSAPALSGTNVGTVTGRLLSAGPILCDAPITQTTGAYQGSITASSSAVGDGAIAFFKGGIPPRNAAVNFNDPAFFMRRYRQRIIERGRLIVPGLWLPPAVA